MTGVQTCALPIFQILTGETDNDKLRDLCTRTHKEQAVWFLNAFWEGLEKHAEQIWSYVHKCNDLDWENHELGTGLDELNAHRLLEAFDETLTVRAMRAELRSTGALGEKESPKTVPLSHYLLCRFKDECNWHNLVHASQGNREEVAEAERRLAEVQAAFAECEKRDGEAARALLEATNRENDAKAREAEALQAEADAKAREAEALAAAEEAKRREEAAHAAAVEAKAREDAAHAAAAEAKAREEAANAAAAEAKAREEAANTAAAEAKDREDAANSAAAEAKQAEDAEIGRASCRERV